LVSVNSRPASPSVSAQSMSRSRSARRSSSTFSTRRCWYSTHLSLSFTRSPATHNMKRAVRMHISIFHCLSDVYQEDLNLLPSPSQSTLAKRFIRPPSKPHDQLLLPIPAQLFQKWIFGPRVVWHLVDALMNVDVACALHPRDNALGCIQWPRRHNKFGRFHQMSNIL
jgi:hypothetical protein